MVNPELAALPQWVVTYIGDKIPLDPKTGFKAETDNPSTWGTYEQATNAVANDRFLTLGFVLTPNDPYICIDLDTYKTFDETIRQNHKTLYERLNSYSELSPSGGGVHIWCRGSLQAGRKLSRQYIEVYPHGRYMTVTGNVLNDVPIRDCQDIINELVQEIDRPIQQDGWVGVQEKETDDQVCKAAFEASNGALFYQLYSGDWQSKYPSQSEADQALVNIIAFYTESKVQVARIFRASQLGQRKKAARQDYLFHARYGIVTRAFDQKNPPIYFSELEAIVKGKVDDEARKSLLVPLMPEETIQGKMQQWVPQYLKDAVEDFTFDELPPGLIGDIAKLIYQNAVRPVKEIAISASIAYFAGIAGKAYNISKTGLNQYIAVLAPTAGGKEAAASGMEFITRHVIEKFPLFEQFIGPSEIASPQALIKQLSTISPCFVSHKAELGFWMQKLTARWAKSNETSLRALLLDLYTKSGHGQIVRGSIYSDKTKDVNAIHSPAFTLFGDSTPDAFYKALDEENIEEGLVARFTVVESLGNRAEYNTNHGQYPPSDLMIDNIIGIAKRALTLAQINGVVEVKETEEATIEHMKFNAECYNKAFEDRDSPEGKLYSRAHLRVLRLAALIAVGINPDTPIVTIECVRWARAFVVQGIIAVASRFASGRVGEVNLTLEQRSSLIKILRGYQRDGYKSDYSKFYGIDSEMYKFNVVTNRFMQQRSMGLNGFRKDRNPLLAYKNMIQEFMENGILERIDLGKIAQSTRRGLAYYIRDVDSINTR